MARIWRKSCSIYNVTLDIVIAKIFFTKWKWCISLSLSKTLRNVVTYNKDSFREALQIISYHLITFTDNVEKVNLFNTVFKSCLNHEFKYYLTRPDTRWSKQHNYLLVWKIFYSLLHQLMTLRRVSLNTGWWKNIRTKWNGWYGTPNYTIFIPWRYVFLLCYREDSFKVITLLDSDPNVSGAPWVIRIHTNMVI